MKITFLVTNDNICSISKSYNKIAEDNKPHAVYKKDIFNYFSSGSQFIDLFFGNGISPLVFNLIDSIDFDDYFQFVCLFSFFNIDQVTSMLLVLSRVYSNVFITKDQVMKFISDYSLSTSFYYDLILLGSQTPSDTIMSFDERYSISNFIYLCENNLEYINYIYLLRQSMKQKIFAKTEYKTIVRRILCKYYPANIKYTHEKCTERIIRKLFTKNPCPDDYDFGLSNPIPQCFTHVIYLLKKQFGYSNRIQFSSTTTYRHLEVKISLH